MKELMSRCNTDPISTLRFKSRFDEFSADHYYKGSIFLFKTVSIGKEGTSTINITTEASRYGIRRLVAVSERLFFEWIDQCSCLTFQRIGVLCHAFLYAIDLDQHNARILEFLAPFFTQGVGYTPVKVKAELVEGRIEYLYFDLA